MNLIRPGNPILDTEGNPVNAHGAGVLWHEGRYYLYGECRPEGPSSLNALIGISCYSSKDLVCWRNEGVVLSVRHDDDLHPLTSGCKMERPKVLFNTLTKKFVMWWHHDIKGWGHSGAFAGTAVSNTPTGPFEYVKVFQPNGCMYRDCTLYQDFDGTAYAIFATDSNANLAICRLDDTYLNPTPILQRAFQGRYMEAPCIFQRNHIYYLIASDCSGWYPNEGRSAWAPTVLGPWKEFGNPFIGPDAEISFRSQSTYVLPVNGKHDAFLYMGDRWIPEAIHTSTYVWLPISFRQTIPYDPPRPFIHWIAEWEAHH